MIYDLTPVIKPDLGVWPGDTPASREVLLDMKRGDAITLSTLRATVHLGAHADAPNHYGTDAASIETRSLEPYLGTCQVIHVDVARGTRFGAGDLKQPIAAPRVLFRTASLPDPYDWNTDFCAPSPELVDTLCAQGVILVGVDVPSVDLFESKDLPSHQRFLANDMAILEGLILTDVPEGTYELIALPLPLAGFDASPVRAVLRTLE